MTDTAKPGSTALATFAGGCFWCMQPPYDELDGVIESIVGYMGGDIERPSYAQVCSGRTGHAEVVEIVFDPQRVRYEQLLDVFWRNIDPTTVNGQFADMGSQYRTAVFYHNEAQRQAAEQSRDALDASGKFSQPIATEIVPASTFWPAEADHQAYYKKNPTHYRAYSEGSGRKGYLRRTWQSDV